MKNNIKSIINLTTVISLVFTVIVIRFKQFNSLYDYIGTASDLVAIIVCIDLIYVKYIWKYIPFEKTPRIYGTYEGIIRYNFNGNESEKNIRLEIKQTLLSVKVKVITDEITSDSIMGNIVEEREANVLYYTYITNPQSKYSMNNPIQYGTCRLIITDIDKLEGIYWTSRRTNGDIELKKN